MRAAVGSTEITPTEALEVAPCLTALHLAVIGSATFTANRLQCRGEWRNTGLGYLIIEFLQEYPFTLKQDKIRKKYQLVKQYKVLILTREGWCLPGKTVNPNVDTWFTDRSGIKNHIGAGVYKLRESHRDNIPMSSLSAMFLAKVMVVRRAQNSFFPKIMTRRRIHICSDSSTAIAPLAYYASTRKTERN
jgi:hypothetical protein